MAPMTPQDLSLLLTYIMGALIVLLVPTIVGIMWKVYSKNTDALKANTSAISELKGQLSIILSRTDEIPEMKKDLNEAHAKIREINARN